MDFNALQHKLFAMDPVDPREDIARMKAQAAAPAVESDGIDYLKESAVVPEGSLQMDRDYSVNDFAALAGVVSEGKQRAADQVRGNEPMPATSTPSNTGEQPHPLKDRLVGESDKDDRIAALERRVEALESMLQERELSNDEEKEKERIVTGMKKNKSDFNNRYGDDAEAVMYATATKSAKQNASVDYSSDIKTRLYDALNKKMGV